MRMRTLSVLALLLALGCDSSDKSKKGDAASDSAVADSAKGDAASDGVVADSAKGDAASDSVVADSAKDDAGSDSVVADSAEGDAGSDSVVADSAEGDAGSDSVVADSAAVTSPCPSNLVGTWRMSFVFCGNTNVTSSINSQGGISGMTLDIRDTGTGCAVVATASGPTCTEVAEASLVPNAVGGHTVIGKGITGCQPAQCVFNPNDAPCALGDGAGETIADSLIWNEGLLIVTTQPPSGLCGSYGTVTTIRYTR
jgi:hypothetical protein